MEQRVKKLEEGQAAMALDIAVIKATMATKQDITDVRKEITDVRLEVAEIKNDVAVIKSNYATKQDLAELKTDMHSLFNNQTKWMVAMMLTTLGIGLTAAKIMF